MGCNVISGALLCSQPSGKRKCTKEKGWINLSSTKTSKQDETQKKKATKDNIPTFDDELEMNETMDFDLFDLGKSLETDIIDSIDTKN